MSVHAGTYVDYDDTNINILFDYDDTNINVLFVDPLFIILDEMCSTLVFC